MVQNQRIEKGIEEESEEEATEKIKQYLMEHNEGKEHNEYLVRGAELQCSCGSHSRKLNLSPCHGVYIKGHPVVHKLDCIPGNGLNAGILPDFHGIIVHDCWDSYWKYQDAVHAVCCAHLLRELTGVEENHPEQKWAAQFKELLFTMKKVKDKALAAGKDEVSYYHLHKFDKQYDEILKTACEGNPLPEPAVKKRGRQKKGKVLNLICRLENYKVSVCLFIKDLCVPFDNNQAERDLRRIKVKTKVSGCFRFC